VGDAVRIRHAFSSLAAIVIAACASDMKAAGEPETLAANVCSTQIIVVLAETTAPEPDAALIADLADTAQVRLSFLRSAGPGIHVFTLRADDPDPTCDAAIERLRRDPRIRSVEMDEHRVRHG
jgi:hypothetical protein